MTRCCIHGLDGVVLALPDAAEARALVFGNLLRQTTTATPAKPIIATHEGTP